MTTQRKTETNRLNGRRGRGPRSVHGKSRSCLNARTHGLNIPVTAEHAADAAIRQIADAIAGENAHQDLLEQARVVAEIELDIARIRRAHNATIQLWSSGALMGARGFSKEKLTPSSNGTAEVVLAEGYLRAMPILRRLDRYERRAHAKRQRALAVFTCLRTLLG